MAHIRNEEFYLYTGLCADNGDCYSALMHLRTIDSNTFKFKHLHYGEPNQHEELLNNLKTWGDNLEDLAFPFVIYTQVYDFEDNPTRRPTFVKGLQQIQSTDWPALYSFEATPQANT